MLRLDEKPIRIEYRVGRGIELSTPIRRAADTNGDFDVSTAEGNAALDARSRVLLAHLRVCTGRTLKQLHCGHLGQQDIERVEADGWVPGATGHLVFSWVLKLHQSVDQIGAVRLEDSYAAPGIEITDVPHPSAARQEAAAGWRWAHDRCAHPVRLDGVESSVRPAHRGGGVAAPLTQGPARRPAGARRAPGLGALGRLEAA